MQMLSKCPLCNSTEFVELFVTRDRHYGIPGNHRIVKCNTCTLVFLNPMYSEEELSYFYPKNYYSYQPAVEESKKKKMLKKLLGIEKRTYDPAFSTPGRVLDIGCGSGWILREMRSKGWDVYGIEPSAAAVSEGAKHGLPIHRGTVLTAQFPAAYFDYIRSNHSFEHMPNPNEVLAEIRRILKPSGRLFIGVPNIASPHAKLFGRYWWYLGAPVHTFNYSDLTLRKLLEKNGFIVEKIRHNGDFGGTVGSLQIWLNRNNGRLSEDGAVYRSTIMRAFGQWLAKLTNILYMGDAIEVTAGLAGESPSSKRLEGN